jgi:hypothetical protein
MERWEILASIITLIWTFFKTTTWYEMRRQSKITRVYEALEVGVQIAWRRVVKPWLEKNEPCEKLPQHIREQAERAAIDAAKDADPIILKTPCDVLHATLKLAVEEAKRRGGK